MHKRRKSSIFGSDRAQCRVAQDRGCFKFDSWSDKLLIVLTFGVGDRADFWFISIYLIRLASGHQAESEHIDSKNRNVKEKKQMRIRGHDWPVRRGRRWPSSTPSAQTVWGRPLEPEDWGRCWCWRWRWRWHGWPSRRRWKFRWQRTSPWGLPGEFWERWTPCRGRLEPQTGAGSWSRGTWIMIIWYRWDTAEFSNRSENKQNNYQGWNKMVGMVSLTHKNSG